MERLTKILKDLGDEIFDTFIKAPYAFGDYLARLRALETINMAQWVTIKNKLLMNLELLIKL